MSAPVERILELRYGVPKHMVEALARQARTNIEVDESILWSRELENECVRLCIEQGLVEDTKQAPIGRPGLEDRNMLLTAVSQTDLLPIYDHSRTNQGPRDSNVSSSADGSSSSCEDNSLQPRQRADSNASVAGETSDVAPSEEDAAGSDSTSDAEASGSAETCDPPMSALDSFLQSFSLSASASSGSAAASPSSRSKRISFIVDNARALRAPDIETLTHTTVSTTDNDTITTSSGGWRLGGQPITETPAAAAAVATRRASISRDQASRFDETGTEERATVAPKPPRRRRSIDGSTSFDPPVDLIEAKIRHNG